MKPPIYICSSGHSLCTSCKSTGRCISISNCTVTNARNLLVEKIMDLLFYSCENNGCDEMHKLKDMNKHEMECQYKIYNCPDYDVCNKRGNIRNLIDHIKTEHKLYDYQNNKPFNFANIFLIRNIYISYCNNIFIFRMKTVTDNMEISLNEIAINFEPKYYTLKFTCENSTSATFTNKCQNFANEDSDTLIIPSVLIKFAKIIVKKYRMELKIHDKS